MRAVDAAQYTQLFTRSREAFEWHPNAGHTDDRVEDCDFHLPAGFFDFSDFRLKLLDEPVVFHGIRVSDLDRLGWRGFSDIRDCLLACAIDGGKVEDVVAGLEVQVAQDRIDASCGIGYKDYGI